MTFLVVGLGNPGPQYQDTRHNAARIVLDSFLTTHSFSDFSLNANKTANHAWGSVGESDVIVVYPETYMNESGSAVASVAKKHALAADSIIVVYDDLDVPLGSIKVSKDKSSGGHNGVKSVMGALKDKKFIRVRVGIAPTGLFAKWRRPRGSDAVSRYVLGTFTARERAVLETAATKVCGALTSIITEGVAIAMNTHN